MAHTTEKAATCGGWEHAPDLSHKCAVLTRRFIRGEVLFDLFDVFDSSHGLVPIDSIDFSPLRLLSTSQAGLTKFGLSP
jgi:hypothetical protein